MIDGTCAHGEALTDGCEECNDAVKARVASRPACPLGVTEDHFCDAVTCNTPVEQLRREAVVSRDLTRRFQAAASKHVAMLWSLDAAQAVEKLLGLLIEHPVRPEVRARSVERARMIVAGLAIGPIVDRFLAARDALEKADPHVSMVGTREAIEEFDAALAAMREARAIEAAPGREGDR